MMNVIREQNFTITLMNYFAAFTETVRCIINQMLKYIKQVKQKTIFGYK